MARPRIPDEQLTPEQLMRRRQNDRARGNVAEKQAASELSLCPQPKKGSSPHSNASIQSRAKPSKRIRKAAPKPTETATAQIMTAALKNSPWDRLLVIALLGLLVICCVLSYHLQVEVYESLKILPEIRIAGYSVVQVSAALVEVLLVALAALTFKGRSKVESICSGMLFLVIGGGTAALLWHGQEVSLHETMATASKKQEAAVKSNEAIQRLKNQRRGLELQRNALLKQIDKDNAGSFAAAGAIGLVRDSLSKLDQIQGKIENIDRTAPASIEVRSMKQDQDQAISERTTLAAEVFRIVLLMVTAFLVHAVLSRMKFAAVSVASTYFRGETNNA